MTSPGKGRYTDYIAGQSAKLLRMHKSFNSNPMADSVSVNVGLLYGSTDTSNQSNNNAAASNITKQYAGLIVKDTGAELVRPPGDNSITDFVYYVNAPSATEVEADIKNLLVEGPPANPYVPDLTSPGASSDGSVNFNRPAGRANLIRENEIKPGLLFNQQSLDDRFLLNTVSPSVSSNIVGVSSVGQNLTKGSSKKDST